MEKFKQQLEKVLNDLNVAKKVYEDAITNQTDLNEPIDNLLKADQIAYNETDKFYEELRKNEQDLSEEELVSCWKLFRRYFEEEGVILKCEQNSMQLSKTMN